MIFASTPLEGAWIIDSERVSDRRGFFARTFCAHEFAARGLKATVAQASLSYSRAKGTLRGMHFQRPPVSEAKLVRCTRGAIHDVIVDLRPWSPSFLAHVAVELTAENRRALYIPDGFAHGFQTLADDTEVVYQMSEFYAPGHEAGLRHDDPSLALEWPLAVTEISEKDRRWPDLDPGALPFNAREA
jgi:dTDP-4-dehydrorhamnose 3,5-epimerase